MSTLDLLRHGEAAPGLCLGSGFDAPLTEEGWAQMYSVLGEAPAPWDGVITSPLIRCADFAAELAERHGLLLLREPRLAELGFGDWEGQAWSELYARQGERLLEFQRDPLCQGGHNPAPAGEHYAEFESRIAAVWEELPAMTSGGHWLVVSHAGVLRAILRRVLGFPVAKLFQIHAPYAGLTRIEHCGEPRLIFHGGKP
ncbi:MAG: alpha-ribazole phosphatase family protein [Methylococcaceae bacterium]|nr:alpha-ribazole phosphatase family protein [Methylococcaceae bacterium]